MPKVLYIENDLELIESFKEVARDAGNEWNIEIARHIIEGKEKIKHVKDYNAYIIDIMLPRNIDGLNKLEPLELERLDKLDKLTAIKNRSEKEREDGFILRKEIELLDKKIDTYLDKEGGIELLTHICKVRTDHIENYKLCLPVIFWTARAAPELIEQCKALVNEDFLKWIEKPEDEESVYKIINNLFEKTRIDGRRKEPY